MTSSKEPVTCEFIFTVNGEPVANSSLRFERIEERLEMIERQLMSRTMNKPRPTQAKDW
jgi:hypothetical protein